MRAWTAFAVIALLGLAVVLPRAVGQESKSTTEKLPARIVVLDPDQIWNFHWEGEKKGGQFLELLPGLDKEGRRLTITHLEMVVGQSTEVQVVQHRKTPQEKAWKKTVRRSALFSLGQLDSTTRFVLSGYSSLVGITFDAYSRPALEVTKGGGDLAVYAEGYWSK